MHLLIILLQKGPPWDSFYTHHAVGSFNFVHIVFGVCKMQFFTKQELSIKCDSELTWSSGGKRPATLLGVTDCGEKTELKM